MKKWFIFRGKDGIPIREEITTVLAGESKIANDYAPMNYLKRIAEERPYKGRLHVTQGTDGNRKIWLEEFLPYAVDVDGAAFLVTGSYGHSLLDQGNTEMVLSEMDLEASDDFIGRCDTIEAVGKLAVLTDYKISGSYKIAQVLGVKESGQRPKFNKDGTPDLYLKSGKWGKAGTQKKEPTYTYNLAEGDSWAYRLQGSAYAYLYERAYNMIVARNPGIEKNLPPSIAAYKVLFIVRDGATTSAFSRGIMKRMYYIPFPIMDFDIVEEFYSKKNSAVKSIFENTKKFIPEWSNETEFVAKAKENEIVPPVCGKVESWDGRRCGEYCAVSHICKMFGDNPMLVDREKEDGDLEKF